MSPLRNFKNVIKNSLAKLRILDPFRFPFREIEFETTTYCNRKCAYCPNSKYERLGAEDGRYMKEETFTKLLDDLAEMNFRGLIAPHFYGEPLTDPRLRDWMARIKERLPGVTLKVVTNGDFFDKDKYNELVRAGVDYFYVSKHSPDYANAFRELLNSLTPQEKAGKLRLIDFYNDYKGCQVMLNTRGGEVELRKNKKHPVCCAYVAYPVIDTFGRVVLCCNDYHSRYISGNIMERTLREIWQDPQNIKLRRRIYQGHFDLPICKNCWV